MRKVAGRELCLTILQLKGDRRLADNIVLHLASTQRYEDVVVAMPMQERGCVRRNFHLEDPNILVFDGAMMTGLGGDLDFARSLPGAILYRGKRTTFYFPLTTSIILSVALSLLLYVIGRLRH